MSIEVADDIVFVDKTKMYDSRYLASLVEGYPAADRHKFYSDVLEAI